MAFMGCTGKGMPNTAPVRTLHRPVKTRVEDREMEFWRERAIVMGRRVPRSPREPESSARGEERRVEIFWRWTDFSRSMVENSMVDAGGRKVLVQERKRIRICTDSSGAIKSIRAYSETFYRPAVLIDHEPSR
jgi:hypothetical protein